MAKKRIYCEINKVEDNEDGTITVSGIASSGAVDSDGETITPEAMKNAIPDYMKFGAVREMHQSSAAGTALSIDVDDVTGKTNFSALVVDEQAIKKVKTSVYKGFSIGGKVTERDAKDKKIIKGLNLIEVSLVDRPANPDALLTMYKAASTPEGDVEELAELLDAGTVTPAQVLALVKASQVAPEVVVPPEGTVNKSTTSAEGDGSMGVPPKGGATPGTDATSAAATNGTVKKGMYSISEFAYALNSISYLVADAAWEATYEADGSGIPAKLFAWLKTGTDILKEMTAEETAEMIEALRQAVGAPEVVEMAAKAGLPGTELQKVGAQFSSKTKTALAAIHDQLKDCCDKMEGLGYKTDDDTESAATGDMGKAATNDTAGIDPIQEAINKAMAPINESLEKLGKENADLKEQVKKAEARFNAMPAPGKALLKAMTKGQDTAQVVKNDTPPETLPPEGTPERAEYEMKKVFASRGLQ